MKYTTDIYLITVLTNLHAGAGDSDFGFVDKHVQRDPVTTFPTIHSSSLKGALRAHFEGENKEMVNYVFGKEGKKETSNSPSEKGHYRFLAADILALPRPNSEGNTPFTIVSSEKIKKAIELKIDILRAKCSLNNYTLDSTKFKELSEELPIIARNHLENGQSENLWYEEIVPHQTLFITYIQRPPNEKYELKLDGETIQIGGNATVGYGLCKFKKISTQCKNEQ